jgi:hypothetical protein
MTRSAKIPLLMNFIQTLAISALPIIFAITLHEAAHGYAARHFGDPTAWQMGRISLNPIRHVDMVGTLLVPALILLVSAGGLLFGWAKPVPVNFANLRRPKQDMLWVAAAGPGANLVMALFWALVLKLAIGSSRHDVFRSPEGNGARRHRHQWRADGVEPAALAAAGRRAHCRQPAAAARCLEVFAAGTLGFSHPAGVVVPGLAG